jgi:hypothetical protein
VSAGLETPPAPREQPSVAKRLSWPLRRCFGHLVLGGEVAGVRQKRPREPSRSDARFHDPGGRRRARAWPPNPSVPGDGAGLLLAPRPERAAHGPPNDRFHILGASTARYRVATKGSASADPMLTIVSMIHATRAGRSRSTDRARREPASRRSGTGAVSGARFSRIAELGSTRLRRRTDTPRAYVEPVDRRTSARFCVSSQARARACTTAFVNDRQSRCDTARSLPTAGPARGAEVPHRASTSVVEIVRTRSEVDVDEGGCSPTRARARCACRPSRIRPAASTPATPAIAPKEGSRCGRSLRRTVDGVEMRTFGDEQVACPAGRHTRFPRDTQRLLLSPGGCGG